MRQGTVLFILILYVSILLGQHRNDNWCFGDSAGINFSNVSAPTTFSHSMRSRGTSVSISDSLGNLMFYANTRAATAGRTGQVWNRVNQIMQNGDNITGEAWYNEMVIIPSPSDLNHFYLFSIGVTLYYGLYYSVIDMTQDSGMGAVIQKNIQLRSDMAFDCLNVVRHGNGRDWWLFYKDYSNFSNVFHLYLIDSLGVHFFMDEAIGAITMSGIGNICFANEGTRMAFMGENGMLEYFDFDRCTGIMSNVTIIKQDNLSGPYWSGASFSQNGNLLYISGNPWSGPPNDSSIVIQYNLLSPNIAASADTLAVFYTPVSAGQLRLAPDDKIYLASCFYDGVTFPYPYLDSEHNYINENLGIINSPNIAGSGCDFQPFSFNLGGNRCYWGLPNNPDYDLGPLIGSGCDTIVNVPSNIFSEERPLLQVFYHTEWQMAFINAQSLKGNNYALNVFDLLGREVFIARGRMNSQLFTKDVNCFSFANGVYIVILQTEKEKLAVRFVKE